MSAATDVRCVGPGDRELACRFFVIMDDVCEASSEPLGDASSGDSCSPAAEFARRGARFSVLLGDTEDGLRSFVLNYPDDYMLFFGRPPTSTT